MTDKKLSSRIANADRLSKSGTHPNVVPKDSATLIILDRASDDIRVLVGRRSNQHVFMPGAYVFPGGRLDRADHSVKPMDQLNDTVLSKLQQASGKRMNPRRAAALAVAAVRETFEETGLVIGSTEASGGNTPGFRPYLSHLRFVARAITPPGRIKRFDTRFFALFADEVGIEPARAKPSPELERLEWVKLKDFGNVKLPEITRAVLQDLTETLDFAPGLPFGRPVPFYYVRNRRFVREEL